MKTHTPLRRITASTTALLALVALLFGVPLALASFAGSPLPDHMPTLDRLGHSLSSPLSDSALLDIVAIIGWLAWAQIAASILVESLAWIRGVRTPRLRLIAPAQPMIRSLIATATFMLSNPAVSGALAAPIDAGSTTTHIHTYDELLPTAVRVAAADTAGIPQTSTTTVSYTVQRRDTLWGLAEDHLGDPFRWREIYELNEGRPQPDGRQLSDPNLILVGWHLTFPDDAIDLPPSPTPPDTTQRPTPPIETEPLEAPAAIPAVPTAPTAVAEPPVDTSSRAGPTTVVDAVPVDPETTTSSDPTTGVGDEAADDAEYDSSRRQLAPLVGGGLLAASLVALIDRHRRTRSRPRQTSPDDEEMWTEIALLVAEPERTSRAMCAD